MSDCEMSSDLVVVHININIMQKVLESSLMTVKDKAEQIKIVEAKEKEVMLAITNILGSICAGMMKNKVTFTNPTHVEAEEEAMEAFTSLTRPMLRRTQCKDCDHFSSILQPNSKSLEGSGVRRKVKMRKKKPRLSEIQGTS